MDGKENGFPDKKPFGKASPHQNGEMIDEAKDKGW
jgi:hypothetical protein